MGTRNYTHVKKYGPFRGLNRGVSNLALQDDFFSLAKNAFISPGSTALTSRPGMKPTALDPLITGKLKVFAGVYVETDKDTGKQYEKELLLNLVDQTAEVIQDFQITLLNQEAFDVYAEVAFDATNSEWVFALSNASTGAVLHSFSLDSGPGIPSTTIGSLVSSITGLANYTATVSTSSADSSRASMALPAQKILVPASYSRELTGYYSQNIPVRTNLITSYSPLYQTERGGIISYTNLNNVLYFALPGTGLCKFDGQAVTKAGAPVLGTVVPRITNAVQGAIDSGTLAPGSYFYVHEFEIRDSKGNVQTGLGECTRETVGGGFIQATNGTTPGLTNVAGGDKPITFTVPNIIGPADNPFEARGAIINGDQTFNSGSPTINVGVGHTFLVGDTACFKGTIGDNSYSGSYGVLFTAVVDSITSTTITFKDSGWTVTNLHGFPRKDIKTQTYLFNTFEEISDITLTELTAYTTSPGDLTVTNASYISNDIRINIYRNKGGGLVLAPTYGTDLYLLDIVVNAYNAPSTSYTDRKPDAQLKVPYAPRLPIGPIPYDRYAGTSPDCSIAHSHQNRMYVAGDPENLNTLYRSDVLYGPEYFSPAGESNLNLETKVASKITAIGSTSDNLVVGKTRGIKLISGDLGTDFNIRVDDLSFELGLTNQASTVSAVDKCIGLTQLGPIEISTQGAWNFIGSQDLGSKSRLEGVIKNGSYDLNFASAAVNPEKGLFFLYLPNKGENGSIESFNQSVLQFNQGGSLTASTSFGSAYVYSMAQDAWFEWTNVDATGGSYVKDGVLHCVRAGSTGVVIYRESNSGTLSDFVDWYSAIDFDVATNWITMGEPFMHKQFLRALIQNVELDPLSSSDFSLTIRAEKDWETTAQSSVTISDLEKVGYGQLKIKGNKSRSMRIRLQHSEVKKRPIISGLTIELAAPFRPKIKQE